MKVVPLKDVLAQTDENVLETLFRKLLSQEPKSKYRDYLTKVAQAGPMGYFATSEETKMQIQLRRRDPAKGVLRSITRTEVALKHLHFVFTFWERPRKP